MKKFLSPHSQNELQEIIIRNKNKNIVFLAGGTDLLVKKTEYDQADIIIDLLNVQELNKIELANDKLVIGSTVNIRKIITDEQIKEYFPLLIEAGTWLGSPQIKNRATIGGNFANASPAGDTIPALYVAKARVTFFSANKNSIRSIPLRQFFQGPCNTILDNGDYILNFEIPAEEIKEYKYAFKKVGQRNALAISKLSVACLYQNNLNKLSDIRFAVGSVAPTVIRLVKTENQLIKSNPPFDYDKISKIVETELKPITDVRSTAEYRKKITAKLVIQIIKSI